MIQCVNKQASEPRSIVRKAGSSDTKHCNRFPKSTSLPGRHSHLLLMKAMVGPTRRLQRGQRAPSKCQCQCRCSRWLSSNSSTSTEDWCLYAGSMLVATFKLLDLPCSSQEWPRVRRGCDRERNISYMHESLHFLKPLRELVANGCTHFLERIHVWTLKRSHRLLHKYWHRISSWNSRTL